MRRVGLEGVAAHRASVLDEETREANDCMNICVSGARISLVLDV
jgi:hypothetical protein